MSNEIITYRNTDVKDIYSKNINVCDKCGAEYAADDVGWYGEYDGQQMCYACYDSY